MSTEPEAMVLKREFRRNDEHLWVRSDSAPNSTPTGIDLMLRLVCEARLEGHPVIPLSEDGGSRFGFLVEGQWLNSSGAGLMSYHEWVYREGDLKDVTEVYGKTGSELLIMLASPEGRHEIAYMPLRRNNS